MKALYIVRICLLAAALTLSRLPLNGQSDMHEYRVQAYFVEHGLSQSSVWCMMQDRQGFMWFGTADGLNRFDGYTFRIFRHRANDSRSLRSNTIRSLCEDRDSGVIWVGTNLGLHRFDRRSEKFTFLPDDPHYTASHLRAVILDIVQDLDGNLWIGSSDGLSILNPTTDILKEYVAASFGWERENQSFRVHFVDSRGDVWISVGNRAYRYERMSGRFITVAVPSPLEEPLSAVYLDRNGTLWMGSAVAGRGLFAVDTASNQWQRWTNNKRNAESISSDYIGALCDDDEGRLWVGTIFGGANVFEPLRNSFTGVIPQTTEAHIAFHDRVSALHRDRSGLMWIGYDGGGILVVNPHRKKFHHVLLPPSYTKTTGDSFLKALMVDRANRVWLGTYSQGLAVLDRATGAVKRYTHNPTDRTSLSSDAVIALLEDRSGRVWIGTTEGLDIYEERSHHLARFALPTDADHPRRSHIVSSLHEDTDGNIWIGTATHIVKCDSKGKTITVSLPLSRVDSLSTLLVVSCFAADRNGIWCGVLNGGLLHLSFDGTILKRYTATSSSRNSLSHNAVKTMCIDPEGILWIGTEGGLNRFDPNRESWRIYRTTDGLPNEFIYGVLMDEHRRLWISTNKGLSRMDTRDYQHPTFRNYTPDDGLQSYEFNTNTYFKTQRGEMFFGGINGFNSFFPDSVTDNPRVPNVVLTGFKKFDLPVQLEEDINLTGEIRLQHDESIFSLEFAALEFTNPARNRYAYKLEGVDKEWVYTHQRREARYTHLDPGEYTFLVKGSNNDEAWNENPTSLRIVIVPPFWRTGWFIGLLVIAGIGTFGGTVRFISTRKLKKKIEQLEREKAIQEERLRTRERIARDLHDDLASTVGSAGFFIESVKSQMKDATTQAKEFLDKTSSLLTEAEEAMSDIVWSVSPKHDTLESLLARMRLTTADLCRPNQIKYEVAFPENPGAVALPEEVRRNIYLIFKEALTNAVRHSGASLIRLACAMHGNTIELRIVDNGKGMPLAEELASTKRGHGVRNMKKRAEEVGGELRIESVAGKGTTIMFRRNPTQLDG